MQLTYQGTVAGLRRVAIPLLRRAAMRGWSLARDGRRIQQALDRAIQRESRSRTGWPRGAA